MIDPSRTRKNAIESWRRVSDELNSELAFHLKRLETHEAYLLKYLI